MPAQSQLPDRGCVHHWLIASPTTGEFSSGTCINCNTVRHDFRNYEEEPGDRKAWNDKGKELKKRKKGIRLEGSSYGYAS